MNEASVQARRPCSNCGTRERRRGSSWCNPCARDAERQKRLRQGKRPRWCASTPEHFWRFVDRCAPEECWEWNGGRTDNGYGQFWVRDKRQSVGAHVYSWFVATGHYPEQQVLHRCDNKPCVNPAHLFLGTQLENMRDKVAKGRQARGASHGMATLTIEQVREIRRRKAGGEAVSAIVRAMGVGRDAAYRVVSGATWRGIE